MEFMMHDFVAFNNVLDLMVIEAVLNLIVIVVNLMILRDSHLFNVSQKFRNTVQSLNQFAFKFS